MTLIIIFLSSLSPLLADEFDDDDLDVQDRHLQGVEDDRFDVKDKGMRGHSPMSSALPPRQRGGFDDDFGEEDDEDAGIVFGNVNHHKKRAVMGGKVVHTPSFKIDSPRVKEIKGGHNAPRANNAPSGGPPGGPGSRPLGGYNPPSRGEFEGGPPRSQMMSGPPVHDYRSMWNEQHGEKHSTQRRFSLSTSSGPALASMVVDRSREIRMALDKLREQDAKVGDGEDDDDEKKDDNQFIDEDSFDSDLDLDPDGDYDDSARRARRSKKKKRRSINSNGEGEGRRDAQHYRTELGMKEKDRVREAIVMLVRSAERAGIDMEDPHNQDEERLSIISDLSEPIEPPSSPAVAKYEKTLRSALIQEWTKQFRFGGPDSVEETLSPAEIFAKMRDAGTLGELLESKEETKSSFSQREERNLASALDESATNQLFPLPEEITIEMPSGIPWEAELECRPGDGRIVFVGVAPDGPADLAGISDGDLLVQVGFDPLRPRDLEAACRLIWERKRNSAALQLKTTTIIVIHANEDHLQRAIAPKRRRGDARRHGLGDQGGTNKYVGRNLMKVQGDHVRNSVQNEYNELTLGLNKIKLSTSTKFGEIKRWGIKLNRGVQAWNNTFVCVSGLSKEGEARKAGLKKGDVLLAILLPKDVVGIERSRHILLSKLGSISRVRKELEYAKEAANDGSARGHDGDRSLEVVVYRSPPAEQTCWLSLTMGFEMATKDGIIVVGKISPSGSAFRAGIRTGDVLVSIDGIRISGPNISLNTALDIVQEARNVALSERRRVLKVESCRNV